MTFVKAAAACTALPLWRPARAQATRLRIGLTAVILADQAAFLARWAAYLDERLGSPVTFVTRDEYQALHDLLAGGQIDALWTCGYPYIRFQGSLRLLAVPIYQGQPTYQAYLIRARGSPGVDGWSALRGKVLAYSDPLSNSGWLVAQGQMAAAGLTGRDLKRAFFAHGHRNVAEAVAAQLAQAGAIDGYVWETMRQQGMSAAQQTEVVWKSPFHGFPPIVSAAGAARLDSLQATLIGMSTDEAGRALLKALNLDGFVAGHPTMFDSIRQLARQVPGSGITA
jgi:phosphonate transport system substrate-binding protein